MADPAKLQAQISEAITQLRQLTQLNVQTGWHLCEEDLAIAEANQPQYWQSWPSVTLNAREHVAWSQGRQVLWLGQSLVIPADLQGYPLEGLVLRLALTWWAESAQIFVNGQLVQEGDLFDCSARILLSAAAQLGETITVALRLVSPGHDDGALVRSLCLYEVASGSATSSSAALGDRVEPSFVADELAVLQQYLTAFAPEKLADLATAIAELDWTTLSQSDRSPSPFDPSLQQLRQTLQPYSDWIKQRQICLLGHAHLDLAWLWPMSETWEAAERTFKSVLQLQQDFPELIFCHSTPALYDWIETNRPALFAAIQAQVAAGRWETLGGLWVEPELNVVSGESIVRQVLYGQRYTQEKFGQTSPVAWLPDTFGFCWQLPQILRQGRIEYFVTQKLRWNDTTQFPYEAFWWRSPDGTEIFSLMSASIGEGMDPIKMTQHASMWEAKTGNLETLWLPGVGDHGGGPTRDMLEMARRWQTSPFLPQLKFATAEEYLVKVRSEGRGERSPTWNDELYLEFHRGCYTTHAQQKHWNRRCEQLLYQAELFASLATLTAGVAYPKAEIEAAWKKVLFNQFHDILPGSSIPEVFVDANQLWQEAEQTGQEVLQASLQAIAASIQLPEPPHFDARPIVVFNSLNWSRSQVVSIPIPSGTESGWQVHNSVGKAVPCQVTTYNEQGESTPTLLFWAKEVPSVGYCVFYLSPQAIAELSIAALPADEWVLENAALRVTVNPQTGDLKSVWDKVQQREVLDGAGNQLQAFQDQGQYWDAWNIDPNYAQHLLPSTKLKSIQWLDRGTLLQRVRVIRQLGQSEFCQDYMLPADAPVVKIVTQVDWQERHVMVKAAFPLTVASEQATYEIPYGAIARPTNPTEPRDKAKWEVPALHWADLSTDDYGVSLLNDCKYGYDAQPNQLRLTLLRGATWPDPEADRGQHQFTYTLYPHAGTWQTAQTVRQGYELNIPLQAIWLETERSLNSPATTLPTEGQFLDLQSENLILSAFKQSEDHPQQWILRCYECHGQPAELRLKSDLGLAIAHPVNLLEQAIEPENSSGTLQSTQIAPWKIATFKVST
ncbi:alpha-mannosidase [Trichocoleus sp. FACHB-591]|uniref:alpha-mannosidase n=1 Tax=Trichocoleus sp. FACHB-591 TaxID=2692872 RepID=UPI0016858E72|nr:alpha-mannosidase [Trichocoleus sp. FACHB-591]MBD2098142.1 alpha-mannosidase [Trichocoleus sp. FACHB-591]